MCSGMGDRTCLLPGFPIRTSPDQSSVDSSPGLFAASHVLLRLLVPRHPPCALTNLATKMLASTVQFSKYGRAPATGPTAHPHHDHQHRDPGRTMRRHPVSPAYLTEGHPTRRCLFPQDPTVCRNEPSHPATRFPHPTKGAVLTSTAHNDHAHMSAFHPPSKTTPRPTLEAGSWTTTTPTPGAGQLPAAP